MSERTINLGIPGEEERFIDIRLVDKSPRLSTYRALDTKRDCDVILKMFHKAYLRSSARLSRLKEEVGKLASVTNPHVVPILNFQECGEHAYATIGFVEGTPLLDWVERKAPQTEDIVKMIAQAADGVAAAHSASVLHRNLQPSSLLITEVGFAKVCDFGLANFIAPVVDARLTGSGYLMGTPGYTAPELYRREPSSSASDVFALGVILYLCLCGAKPYQNEKLALYALDGLPISLSTLPPSCCSERADEKLDAIVLRAIALDKEERYASMNDFCTALMGWLKERSVCKGSGKSSQELVKIEEVTKSKKQDKFKPLIGALCMAASFSLFSLYPTYRELAGSFIRTEVSVVAVKDKALGEKRRGVIPRQMKSLPPLHLAAASGSMTRVRTIISTGAALDDEDYRGFTALHHAVRSGQKRVVATLLTHGANINAANEAGETPLHLTCAAGSIEVTKVLLQRGADINRVDDNGDTSLARAAACGHRAICELLLAQGANKHICNRLGKNPGRLARENGYPEVAIGLGL